MDSFVTGKDRPAQLKRSIKMLKATSTQHNRCNVMLHIPAAYQYLNKTVIIYTYSCMCYNVEYY